MPTNQSEIVAKVDAPTPMPKRPTMYLCLECDKHGPGNSDHWSIFGPFMERFRADEYRRKFGSEIVTIPGSDEPERTHPPADKVVEDVIGAASSQVQAVIEASRHVANANAITGVRRIYELDAALEGLGSALAALSPTPQPVPVDDDLRYRFGCLLDHATGGVLSKTDYAKETMYKCVDDHIARCIERAKQDDKADADDSRATPEKTETCGACGGKGHHTLHGNDCARCRGMGYIVLPATPEKAEDHVPGQGAAGMRSARRCDAEAESDVAEARATAEKPCGVTCADCGVDQKDNHELRGVNCYQCGGKIRLAPATRASSPATPKADPYNGLRPCGVGCSLHPADCKCGLCGPPQPCAACRRWAEDCCECEKAIGKADDDQEPLVVHIERLRATHTRQAARVEAQEKAAEAAKKFIAKACQHIPDRLADEHLAVATALAQALSPEAQP